MEKQRTNLLFSLFKGALIGTGAILPGVSGGVLCVALGVYRPMMALLAHPIRELKARPGFFAALILGFLLGVLGLSRLVDWLFRASPVPAVWLFIGLIVGTMPSLWREAGREGRSGSSWAAGGVAFALMLAFLLTLKKAGGMQVEPSVWTWLLCGVLWGIGLIAPGLSPSSLFIFMGVYQPMAAGIADLSLPLLLPMGAGLLLCVLTLSHGVSWLLKHCYAPVMHAILGVSLASTVMIVPLDAVGGWTNALLYALCFGIGLMTALWMDRMNDKMEAAGQKT
ncbi:MAG: DUF368 domain-containing protein [Eubacteriales bacterium]|nr:DUF368 domain-containing protein [Eubacteriales bacterium]